MAFTEEEVARCEEAVNRLGSQVLAAKELGMSRSALQRRLYSAKESFLTDQAEGTGFDLEEVDHYWIKTKEGSFHVKRDTEVSYADIRQDFIESAKVYAPKYIKKRYEPSENLLIVDPADVHFGKKSSILETGYEYGIEETTEKMRDGMFGLLNKSSKFGVEKSIFVMGNDILHIDSPHRKTTSGTPQDTDGQWWQAFTAAKQSYISAIEEMTEVSPVHLVFCPSNHDYMSGWMLADSVCSWFHNNPNVCISDGSVSIAHRKYAVYGNSILGFTHGDGARENELAQIMQYEAREAWGQATYSYWFTHHTHHKNRMVYGKNKMKIEKDHTGVTILNSRPTDPKNNVFVETVRTPSPPDGWHDRNGYKNVQAIEAFLIEPYNGMSGRFTHHF